MLTCVCVCVCVCVAVCLSAVLRVCAGGWYHGKLKFPPDYPFAPPGIMMHTPSGRFEVNMRLCLSMSDYHPETWQASVCSFACARVLNPKP
jgi:hypothetical protein